MSYQPTKWSELLYVQRQPEDKNQFDNNWDRIFGKKAEEEPKQEENINASTQGDD